MKRRVHRRLILTLLIAPTGCGSDDADEGVPEPFDTSGILLGTKESGFYLSDFASFGQSARRMADGSIEAEGTALVTIVGKEPHKGRSGAPSTDSPTVVVRR